MPLDQVWARAQSNIPERVPVDDVLRRLAWMYEVERVDPDKDSQLHQDINITTVAGTLQQNIEGFVGVCDFAGAGNFGLVNAFPKDFVYLGYSANNTSVVIAATGSTTVHQWGAAFATRWDPTSTSGTGFTWVTSTQENAFTAFATTPTHEAPYSTDQKTQDEATFQSLAAKWKEERGISSSTHHIIMCKSYQRIIGMGLSAIPLILAQLRKEGNKPGHWFWALESITRENPVPLEYRSNRKMIARYWLSWGDQHGYTS